MVLAGSVEKARWLRDLQRFLPLRSQFVLSGNTRDLQIHEPIPGTITAVPLARALPDALKEAGYQRIASFDLLNGFRALEPTDDSFLTQLGLTPVNGVAAGGVDLLSAALERLVGTDGPPAFRARPPRRRSSPAILQCGHLDRRQRRRSARLVSHRQSARSAHSYR